MFIKNTDIDYSKLEPYIVDCINFYSKEWKHLIKKYENNSVVFVKKLFFLRKKLK